MQLSQIPTAAKFPVVFASGASGTYVTYPSPSSPYNVNRASLQLGFPPNTFVDPAAGGSWPDGRDFQGVLEMCSAWLQWIQAGGPFPAYDIVFQSAIGGYFNTAIVASVASPGSYWQSQVDNNLTNPDAGGSGWRAWPVVSATSGNPTALAGPTAINGSASTFMRSDAAPAVQLGSATQPGIVRPDNTSIVASAGVISTGFSGANPTAVAGSTAVNGSSANFMRADAAPAVRLGSNSQTGIVQADGTSTQINGSGVISAFVVYNPVIITPTSGIYTVPNIENTLTSWEPAGAGPYSLTMQLPNLPTLGFPFYFKVGLVGEVTGLSCVIQPAAGGNVDGNSNYTLTQGTSGCVVHFGSNAWRIVTGSVIEGH